MNLVEEHLFQFYLLVQLMIDLNLAEQKKNYKEYKYKILTIFVFVGLNRVI
jgi:hypothetical protein